MTFKKMMSVRLGIALLMGTALGTAAEAQTASFRESAGTALTRHLRTIADQPRNVSALIGAGKAALELGDPQAALTFFARAEEIAPRDGRIKAGMGAAFVQMEQVHAGLKFFEDAASLGVPEAEFAGDRGLAHDLNGDPRRAQADYALALRRQEDPEVRRRLALSLAISGERDKAIATIDRQLRNQDRAAWRVRSFILALTGDAAEATRSAEAVMPAQAAQMRPFFAALPALKPAERAMAVHFGHFPNDGRPLQVASAGTQYANAAPATASADRSGQQSSLPRRGKAPETVSTAPRRRPGSEENVAEEPRQRRNSSLMADRYGYNERRAARRKKAEQPKPTALAEARTPAVAAPPQDQRRTQQPAAAAVEQPGQQIATQPVATAQAQLTAPPLQTAPLQTPPAAGSAPAPLVSAQTQPVTPSLDLGASRAAPAQAQPSATSGIQLAEIAPSEASGPTVGLPEGTAAGPVLSQQAPARATGLAAIAAAIESLPGDGAPAAAAKTAPAPAVRIASNNAAKPAYGPKFEAAKPEGTAAASASTKTDAAGKEASAKAAAARKDDAKTAAAKKNEPKAAAVKKEEAKAAAAKKGEEAKTAATKKEAAAKLALTKKEEAAKPKETSRHWVQIAGGANEAAMTREFLRLKAKAPKLLSARTAWTTPLRATNRLLVGPFKTSAEAQEFVNELAKLDLPAFSWTSPAGQEIVKLAAGSKSSRAN